MISRSKTQQVIPSIACNTCINNLKYLVAPNAKGLPAELTPKLVAAYIAASLAKSFLANPK